MTFKNRQLDHLNLAVPNMEKAVKFYTEIMGFEVVASFNKGMHFVFITDGNNTYELIEKPEVTDSTFDHIAYVSTDIQTDYAYFKELGITTTEVGYVDFLFEKGVYYFFIKGANNEKIEFIQRA